LKEGGSLLQEHVLIEKKLLAGKSQKDLADEEARLGVVVEGWCAGLRRG